MINRECALITRRAIRWLVMGALGAASVASAGAAQGQSIATSDREAIERGEYLFGAAGCAGCHTDVKNKGPVGAGGRELKTPFGVFYGPNITPDRDHGIGRWSDADFIRALRNGVSPRGEQYYPVFPFTSFTKISDGDILDIKAYLLSLRPSPTPNRAHRIGFPFNLRFAQYFWKLLFFDRGAFVDDSRRSAELNRGGYLVAALGHCGECHTPRNLFGASDRGLAYAGTRDGPDGAKVPNITPDRDTGIGMWSAGDLAELLTTGMTPDGDFVGGSMAEVVRETTSKLSRSDLKAMVAYLRALPPIRNDLRGR
ncbi:MAG TPA: cytochrome c [Alphaproteobacteria bacterium]|nr:cytochrome c [Alphaproteobacteria bacterium]